MAEQKQYAFELEFKVRDYECDLQGVVNNANYQHYLEHTRHEYLESLGVNFGQMHEEGLDAFVYNVNIGYRRSLKSGNRFRSVLSCRMKGAKLIFDQDLIHLSGELAATAQVEVVLVKDGAMTRGEYFRELLKLD